MPYENIHQPAVATAIANVRSSFTGYFAYVLSFYLFILIDLCYINQEVSIKFEWFNCENSFQQNRSAYRIHGNELNDIKTLLSTLYNIVFSDDRKYLYLKLSNKNSWKSDKLLFKLWMNGPAKELIGLLNEFSNSVELISKGFF